MLDKLKIWIGDRMESMKALRFPGFHLGIGGKTGIVVGVLVVYLVITLVLGLFWSRTPAMIDIESQARLYHQEQGFEPVVGSTTSFALYHLSDVLLNKPGGYLSNDITMPGVWLDNMPSWEFGVVVQMRDMSRALRKDLSRSQSQSTEDADLSKMEPNFNFDHDSWLIPSTEGKYREAQAYLESYMHRLADPTVPNAQFFARSDNLRNWLSDVSTRLGSYSQRLSASVGQTRVNTDLASDSANIDASTPSSAQPYVKTPWLEIDNVFYETRGAAWALLHLLKAVEVDFAAVLEKKNATASLQQIIRELEATQAAVWSPVILNGGGFGVFANHSLVMANYISRANAAIIDLRNLLEQG